MLVILQTMVESIIGIGKACRRHCQTSCNGTGSCLCNHKIERFEEYAAEAQTSLNRTKVLRDRVQSTEQLCLHLSDLLAYEEAAALTQLAYASRIESEEMVKLAVSTGGLRMFTCPSSTADGKGINVGSKCSGCCSGESLDNHRPRVSANHNSFKFLLNGVCASQRQGQFADLSPSLDLSRCICSFDSFNNHHLVAVRPIPNYRGCAWKERRVQFRGRGQAKAI